MVKSEKKIEKYSKSEKIRNYRFGSEIVDSRQRIFREAMANIYELGFSDKNRKLEKNFPRAIAKILSELANFNGEDVDVSALEKTDYVSYDWRRIKDVEEKIAELKKATETLSDEEDGELKEKLMTIVDILEKSAKFYQTPVDREDLSPKYYDKKEQKLLVKCQQIFRCPFGAPVWMQGFVHHHDFYVNHAPNRQFYAGIASQVGLVGIEGISNKEIGKSLGYFYEKSNFGHYDKLMRDVWDENSQSVFFEIDPRNQSKVFMENRINKNFITSKKLPDFVINFQWQVLQKYFYPHRLADLNLKSANDLANFWHGNSLECKFLNLAEEISLQNKEFFTENLFGKINKTGQIEYGNEVPPFVADETSYADAVSALKLHFLAKNQAEQKLLDENGETLALPAGIIDFEGSNHIPAKRYFFDHPVRAMMVVLANVYCLHQEELTKEFSEFLEDEENQLRQEHMTKELTKKLNDPQKLFNLFTETMQVGFLRMGQDGKPKEWKMDLLGQVVPHDK